MLAVANADCSVSVNADRSVSMFLKYALLHIHLTEQAEPLVLQGVNRQFGEKTVGTQQW